MKSLIFLMSFLVFAQDQASSTNKKYTKAYLEKISKRYKGQTEFARQTYLAASSNDEVGRASGRMSKNSENREIQEADVFKVGEDGSKELFLLNSYRGFQVISFKNGASNPEIIGRLPLYNQYSSEMYFDKDNNTVFVLNTEYDYSYNYWNSNYYTKVYQIDVSDSRKPKLVSTQTIGGYLEASRMVGDVLYVVTESWDRSERKAAVTSLKLVENKMKQIDSQELHSKNVYVNQINVLKKNQKYYILTSRSNWSMNEGYVDLYDITSKEGKIKKVQTVKTKGRVNERSQMFLHQKHIVTVTNFRKDRRDLAKIAVEAFPMKETKNILTSSKDKYLVLRDTNGLNASLQDVRVSDNLLYTFWVPANNIDPFDLVDMSDLKNGLKYLGRLEFDGWVSKAFPMTYKGKKYVLGLGEVIPATSEQDVRYPQAKIFEIIKTDKGYKHVDVETLTMNSERVRSALNSEDKYFEIMSKGNGKFDVLFPVTFLGKRWRDNKNGAKIVEVNLSKGSLDEGQKIVGDSRWLKRVFLNKEIDKINTFSDKELSTFGSTQDSKGFANALSVLELARNIIDFKITSSTTGVQIIKNESNVELREVSLENVDAEKKNVLKRMTIPGNPIYKKITSEKAVFIMAKFSKSYASDDKYPDYKNSKDLLGLYKLTFDLEKFKVTQRSKKAISIKNLSTYVNVQDFKLKNTLLLNIGKSFVKVKDNDFSLLYIDKNSCKGYFVEKRRRYGYQPTNLYQINEKLLKTKEIVVEPVDKKKNDYRNYGFTYMAELSVNDKKISCSKSINIPGNPVDVIDNILLTTSGYNYGGFRPSYEYASSVRRFPGYYYSNQETYSLSVKRKVATLMDKIKTDLVSNKFSENKYLTHNSKEGRFDIWSITQDGEFISRPRYIRETQGKNLVKTIKKNNQMFLVLNKKNVMDLYSLDTLSNEIEKKSIKSKFDKESSNVSEYVYNIRNMTLSDDSNKLYVSQGMYGLLELELE